MAQEANSRKGKLGGLFDDLSIAQVVAGALAAVTSMLLASQIGIYGSAIGVGVGSVVSAVASQLYKKFLQRSADKLKEIHPGETLAMDRRTARVQAEARVPQSARGRSRARTLRRPRSSMLPRRRRFRRKPRAAGRRMRTPRSPAARWCSGRAPSASARRSSSAAW